MKPADLKGHVFGRLTVIDRANKSGRAMWLCNCECGSHTTVATGNLKRGSVRSCGCLRRETLRAPRKHGMFGTRIYEMWNSMHKRCRGTSTKDHKRLYRDRGITVCVEWSEFQSFHDWAMANGYSDTLTIDRIDPNGNYCPSNCRFATMKTQQNNRRNNRIIEINGRSQTLAEWSAEIGLSQGCIQERIRRGWDEVKAVTTPQLRTKTPASRPQIGEAA